MSTASVRSLPLLYEGSVAPDEIDQMGHMNMRFYGTKAMEAVESLAASLSLDAMALGALGAGVFVFDSHTRQYREQLEGAPLEIRGGVLDANQHLLTVYLEMTNRDTHQLAATYTLKVGLCARESRAPMMLEHGVIRRAKETLIEWPAHGQPRSLPIVPFRQDLTQEAAAQLKLRRGTVGVLAAEDCDAFGFLALKIMQGFVPGAHPNMKGIGGTHDFPGGLRIGSAVMESRSSLFEAPQAGDRLQTISAVVVIGAKNYCWRHWLFNVDRGRLLRIHQVFAVSFDLATRKSIEIRPEIRARMVEVYHPELIEDA